jgi:AraC-like DNA-binding protein
MGISPHQYVIQQRVERAVMLLKTDLTIAQKNAYVEQEIAKWRLLSESTDYGQTQGI